VPVRAGALRREDPVALAFAPLRVAAHHRHQPVRQRQRLLDGLGEVRTRTNIIFVGDNGTPREVIPPPIPQSHGKISPYEAGIRVPLIVQGPAVQSPGRVVKCLTYVVDLFPLVLELCGVSPATGLPGGHAIDGVSFVPYLRDPTQPKLRSLLYSEMFTPNGPFDLVPKDYTWRIVRNDRYKLIRREGVGGVAEEFFDLNLDPMELTDLIGTVLDPGPRKALEELREAVAVIPNS
jgi:arylsulfatase A-like enzyme